MKRERELSSSLVKVYDKLVYVKYLSINELLTDDELITSLSECFEIIESVDVIQL